MTCPIPAKIDLIEVGMGHAKPSGVQPPLFEKDGGCLENDDLENDDLENNNLENDDLENDSLENNNLENDDLENSSVAVVTVVSSVAVWPCHLSTNRMGFCFFRSKCVVIVSSSCDFPTRGGL